MSGRRSRRPEQSLTSPMESGAGQLTRVLRLYGLNSVEETFRGQVWEDVEKWRRLGLEDLYFFATVVLGMTRMGVEPMGGPFARRGKLSENGPEVDFSLHMDMAAVFKGDWDGKSRLHMLVPRDHFKTSLITTAAILQELARDPNQTFLLVGATFKDQAKGFLAAIKNHIDNNPVLRSLYPGLRPGNLWTADRVNVLREVRGVVKENSILAMAAGGTPESGHYDWIFCDDLVSDQNVATRGKAQKIVDFFAMLSPLRKERGRIVNIGTRYADYDLHGDIKRNHADEFFLYERPAAYDDAGNPTMDFKNGWSLFPEEWPPERLQAQLDAMMPMKFSAQYLNDPVPAEYSTIQRTWVDRSWESVDDIPDGLTKYIGMDPSTGQGEDFCAIYVVGIDKLGIIHTIDREVGRWTFSKQVEKFFELYEKHDPVCSQIEAMGSGAAVEQGITEESQKRNIWPACEFVHWRPRKEIQVVTALQPRFEAGTVRLPAHLKNSTLEEQLIRFPKGTWDDEVDALCMAVDIAARFGYIGEETPPPVRRTGPLNSLDELDDKDRKALQNGELSVTMDMLKKGLHLEISGSPGRRRKRVLRL